MSSVYKKGRDGYYYYQTYVFNPESKKKDKRVFHALGTKDLAEAKAKQHEFDMQYENRVYNAPNTKKFLIQFSVKKLITIMVVTVLIAIYVFDLFKANTTKQPSSFTIVDKNDLKFIDEIDVSNQMPTINQQDSLKIDLKTEIPFEHKQKIMVPKYHVERVDRLSGVFQQGKVYVTIDEKSSYESQRLLCKELVKKYEEFSNIVICLYTDDYFGKELAMGNNENISVEKQKQSWLAMYTYNSVEGEYFDNNPSGYLGIY